MSTATASVTADRVRTTRLHAQRRLVRQLPSIVASILGVALASAPATAGNDCARGTAACPGHFLCYKVKPAKAPKGAVPFPRFTPRTIDITDRFGGPFAFDLQKTLALCNPADKNDEDPGASARAGHLLAYQARRGKSAPKFDRKGSVFEARNQLHPDGLKLKIKREDRPLIASAKVLGTGGTTGEPPAELADYKCYNVAVAKAKRGQAPFPRFTPALGVEVTDQFGSRLFDLTKPVRGCHPIVNEGGAPPDDAPADLVCYQAKLAKRPKQEKIAKQQVSTNDAFGPQFLESAAAQELCIPSNVNLSAEDLTTEDLIRTFDDVPVQLRLVHENFPDLLRPAAEWYYPEIVALIAGGLTPSTRSWRGSTATPASSTTYRSCCWPTRSSRSAIRAPCPRSSRGSSGTCSPSWCGRPSL